MMILVTVIGVTMITASPVAAKSKPPKFSGAAPGSVTCTWSAKVAFSPPLTNSGGGTNPSQVTAGKLSRCVASDSAVTISKGTFTGSFASSPMECAEIVAATGAAATLTLSWKGDFNGSVGATTYAGKARFLPSTATGRSGTGSFSGGVGLIVNVPRNSAVCGAIHGAKMARLTGTITMDFVANGYMTDFYTGAVTPFDTATNSAGYPIPVGSNPEAIAITPDGSTAYAANFGSNTVTPINTATNTAGTPIPVVIGSGPQGIAISPDGSIAYVANEFSDAVTPINTATNTAGGPIHVGGGSSGIAITPDGSTAYVALEFSNTVTPIDLATYTAGTPIPVGSGPIGIAITHDGSTVYVANELSNTVTPINTATNTAGTPISVGNSPVAIAITPDGSTAYVANLDSNTVTPINTATNTAGTPIPVGSYPAGIAIG
jgi:YVTN family beta-propeller protein